MARRNYLPVSISLDHRPVVVYGGGAVAERKVQLLLDFNAQVTVISPRLTPLLKALVDEEKIVWRSEEYKPGEIHEFSLAFVATDDERVNQCISKEAREHQVLVNVADDPQHCDFILPAIAHKGPLSVAVSTAGVSPALAGKLRKDFEEYLGDEYENVLSLLEALRDKLLQEDQMGSNERGERLREFVGYDIASLYRQGRQDEIDGLLRKLFGYSMQELGL